MISRNRSSSRKHPARAKGTWYGAALCIVLLVFASVTAQTTQPSRVIVETIQRLDARLKQKLSVDELVALDTDAILKHATADEKAVLGTRYLTFDAAGDADVYVMTFALDRNKKQQVPEQIRPPFWLAEQGWQATPHRVIVQSREFAVWRKRFPAGTVGVGMHSFNSDGPQHLWVAVKGVDVAGVTNLPPRAKLDVLAKGKQPFVDRAEVVTGLPAELEGAVLLRPHSTTGRQTKLAGKYHKTPFPSSTTPDFVTLTWSSDPRTTQTIQWRTSTSVARGIVELGDGRRVEARTKVVSEATTLNDADIHWHTAQLTGLKPDTTYNYRVGDGERWSQRHEFTTAPSAKEPFTFVYLGDAQNGLDEVGRFLLDIRDKHPQARFFLIAGDLVEYGDQRAEWDAFFGYAKDVYATHPIVPVIGNHDVIGGGPRLYLSFFDLPTDGPADLAPGRAYTLTYGPAMLAVLDSNLDTNKETQAAWLAEKLQKSSAPWKFTSFHHPLYSGTPGGDNQKLRDTWAPVMEKHGVSCALQGHIHAYFRSHPLKDGKIVAAADGTTYCVAVCGTKCYPSEARPYGAMNLRETRTYQLITVSEKTLEYRAFNTKHELIDQMSIQK